MSLGTRFWLILLAASASAIEPAGNAELLKVKRIHVERLSGGETAAHLRDMIIASLEKLRYFRITEDPQRADAVLRGSAEDLVFTDTFQTSESVDARTSIGLGSGGSRSTTSRRGIYGNAGIGSNESTRISERKHEAAASVRLVTPDGDVIWSTTQESLGAKFKGASADVAEKIARQLNADIEKARRGASHPKDANTLPR
jgi:hypothetical protein